MSKGVYSRSEHRVLTWTPASLLPPPIPFPLPSIPHQVLAVGCKRLWRLHWTHRFDMIILGASIASYVVIGIPGNRRALYVDKHPGLSDLIELPRAMMVLRCVPRSAFVVVLRFFFVPFLFPSHLLSSPFFSLPLLVVTDPGSQSRLFRLPTMLRSLRFYREKTSVLSFLVGSHRMRHICRIAPTVRDTY